MPILMLGFELNNPCSDISTFSFDPHPEESVLLNSELCRTLPFPQGTPNSKLLKSLPFLPDTPYSLLIHPSDSDTSRPNSESVPRVD